MNESINQSIESVLYDYFSQSVTICIHWLKRLMTLFILVAYSNWSLIFHYFQFDRWQIQVVGHKLVHTNFISDTAASSQSLIRCQWFLAMQFHCKKTSSSSYLLLQGTCTVILQSSSPYHGRTWHDVMQFHFQIVHKFRTSRKTHFWSGVRLSSGVGCRWWCGGRTEGK